MAEVAQAKTSTRAGAGKSLLQVRGLHAWYGESHVLHGIDFDVAEGETVTLIGRNEVWLRIQKNLNLTPEMLFRLATGRTYVTGEKTDG